MPKPFYPQSLNRFAYAYNNPIRLIDLDGHETGNADGGNFADVDEENEEESAFGGYVREIVQEHYGHWIDAANGKATVEDLGYIVADIVTAGRGKVATSVISKGIKSVKGVGKTVEKVNKVSKKSGVPGDDFVPNPNVTEKYSRPRGAGPTTAQKASVQGKPCVDCGAITPKQVADHKDPLVVQYYREGAVNVQQQKQLDAVQPHCSTCSNIQGGQLGTFGKKMKEVRGL